MKIYSHDKLAENVKIGDPLKLMINIDKQDFYGLHITDCLVRDGIGWGEQRLIDSDGCPLDREILGPFSYDSDRTMATVAFPAHKFPYTSSVYYQCNVRLCSLGDENCHKVSIPEKNGSYVFNFTSMLCRRPYVMVRKERSEKQILMKMDHLQLLRCFQAFTLTRMPKYSVTISTLSSKRR